MRSLLIIAGLLVTGLVVFVACSSATPGPIERFLETEEGCETARAALLTSSTFGYATLTPDQRLLEESVPSTFDRDAHTRASIESTLEAVVRKNCD